MNAKPKQKFVTRDDKRFQYNNGYGGIVITLYEMADRMDDAWARDAAINHLNTLAVGQEALDNEGESWKRVV